MGIARDVVSDYGQMVDPAGRQISPIQLGAILKNEFPYALAKKMSKRSDRQKYATCMGTIRHRLEVIDRFLARSNTTGYEVPDAETVCLQFRKIFEGIAMSSLCANREKCEEARKSFAKEWQADRILRFVESLNPHFYPVPIWRKFHSVALAAQSVISKKVSSRAMSCLTLMEDVATSYTQRTPTDPRT